MKRKKYAYLFATTVLLANVATTPITVIAETMQENSSSEVAEKQRSKKNQEEPLIQVNRTPQNRTMKLQNILIIHNNKKILVPQ